MKLSQQFLVEIAQPIALLGLFGIESLPSSTFAYCSLGLAGFLELVKLLQQLAILGISFFPLPFNECPELLYFIFIELVLLLELAAAE